MPPVEQITPSEYQQFKDFLEDSCGILLGEGKQYLIVSRLAKLLRDEQVESFSELVALIQQPRQKRIRNVVIDAMTTNETSWFRDRGPFSTLKKEIFPAIEQNGRRGCRIWSAACSSGQEPYTISMILSEYLETHQHSGLQHSQIIATDISANMIEEAKAAYYDQATIDRGLSTTRRQSFFKVAPGGWTVSDDIKQRVSFRQQNLLEDYAELGKFDIIFCRNVLIYFSPQRKADILNRMAAIMRPGGYLFLGASETTLSYSDAFEMVRSPSGVFFRLKPTA